MKKLPCVLVIAGTDPSAGAGIQADLKAISATGAYAATVISALVSQNTQGVQAIETIKAKFFLQQIESVLNDINIAAIKIGMLFTKKNITTVAKVLSQNQISNVVLDPVFIAKNGSPLLKLDLVKKLSDSLFAKCTLITPNIFEAEQLLGKKIKSKNEQESCGIYLGNKFKTNFLIKGGHLEDGDASDFLFLCAEQKGFWFSEPRIKTKNTHGTGCSLSSAIASYLAQDYSIIDAVEKAKNYVSHAIRAGSDLSIGKGQGPIDHFWRLRAL